MRWPALRVICASSAAAGCVLTISACGTPGPPPPKPHEASDYYVCMVLLRPGISEPDRIKASAERIRRNLDCRPYAQSILAEYEADARAQAQRDAAASQLGAQLLRQSQPQPAPALLPPPITCRTIGNTTTCR